MTPRPLLPTWNDASLGALLCCAAQEVAEYVSNMARRRAFDASAVPLDSFPIAQVFESSLAVFIVSTTGDGEVPSNMSTFWRFLLRRCKMRRDRKSPSCGVWCVLQRYGSVRSYMRSIVCSRSRSAAALCPVFCVLCASLVSYTETVFLWLFQSSAPAVFFGWRLACSAQTTKNTNIIYRRKKSKREMPLRPAFPPLGGRPRDIHSSIRNDCVLLLVPRAL